MEQKRESGAWKAFQEAFPYTVPIFAGFWFVAFSYGIYMHSMGFSFLYPALMAAFIAWDMGRLVLIARCCFECGYITEEKAWCYMEEAHKKCCAVYGDWKEFAAGYVIGRCMWGGMKQMPGGIMGIAEGLLRDPESPWQKVQLHVFEM